MLPLPALFDMLNNKPIAVYAGALQINEEMFWQDQKLHKLLMMFKAKVLCMLIAAPNEGGVEESVDAKGKIIYKT